MGLNLYKNSNIYFRGAETGVFWQNKINTVAIIIWFLRSSVAMVLTVYDAQFNGFHEERMQLPTPFQCRENINKMKQYFLCHIKAIQSLHYSDVIMSATAPMITSILSIVCF